MRKIIVTEFITLDGVIEAPGGDETPHPQGGWQRFYSHPDIGKYKKDELAAVEGLLLGRITYDGFAGYWPEHGGDWFGDRMNELPKFVVSRSMDKVDWNNSRLLRDVATEVAALKQTDGGDLLVYGSGTLSKSLLQHDLIDELRLLMYPVSIGGGLRLFDDGREMKKFTLRNSRATDNGILILEYLPEQN